MTAIGQCTTALAQNACDIVRVLTIANAMQAHILFKKVLTMIKKTYTAVQGTREVNV